jgi:hypothetical protein
MVDESVANLGRSMAKRIREAVRLAVAMARKPVAGDRRPARRTTRMLVRRTTR